MRKLIRLLSCLSFSTALVERNIRLNGVSVASDLGFSDGVAEPGDGIGLNPK